MTFKSNRIFYSVLLVAAIVLALTNTGQAQGTAFTYQSRLNDNGALANGNYDLQFSLYDALNGGAQIGATLNKTGVAIANGVFIVQLDFGASAFSNGGQRFLQIAVRPAGTSDPYTTLSPRTEITSTPYAIRSLSAATADNATQLNGTNASQYVQTNDTRLSDARDPKPGSANYIQNGTTLQAGNFSVSGNGTVGGTLAGNTINATAQFNLNGSRILHATNRNLSVGINAGLNSDPTTIFNTFVGFNAGRSNAGGLVNTMLGARAGENNTGNGNTFVGSEAGFGNTTGAGNTYIGRLAGSSSFTGDYNTAIGTGSQIFGGQTYATAIGGDSVADCSDCVVLGRVSTNVRWSRSLLSSDQSGSLELGGNNSTAGTGTPYIDFHFNGRTEDFNVRLINYQSGKLQLSGQLDAVGQVCAANLICTSDARLKEQIKTLRYGLPDLLKLRPVSWQWKDRTNKQLALGMIAQDVEKVMPELLLHDPNPDGPLGLNYVGFVPVIIKAVQEQQRILEQKDTAIRALQLDNKTLQQRNMDLQLSQAKLEARLIALEKALQQLQGAQAAAKWPNKPAQ